MFYQNGTLKQRTIVSIKEVVDLQMAPVGGTWVMAEDKFGIFSGVQAEFVSRPCPLYLAANVTNILVDGGLPSRLIVSLDDGAIVVYETIQNQQTKKRVCDLAWKFPDLTLQNMDLTSVSG